jgi:hypothetical protein
MGLLDKLQDYFGRSVSETRRTADNNKVVDALTIEDDIDNFIRKDALQKHETNRLVHVMFKQVRQKNNHVLTNMELFLDKWCQHHGPIVTRADVEAAKKAGVLKGKLPVENFTAALNAVVRYGRHIAKIATAKQEAAEWRAMQGPLGEFEDLTTPMSEMPGDEDIEKYILKQHPEFNKFKKYQQV